jgi:protein phosphatase
VDRRWGYGTEQRLRDDNQDTHGVFAFRDFTLAVVCDGMGGHHGGAHASALAVRSVHDALLELQDQMPLRDALTEAVRRANQAIYDASRRSHRLMGMGTTVAAAAITGTEAHVAHVGDSRVYLVRNGEALQLTRDHTMVNLFVEAELLSPEDAASHPEAHVLSRSLGVERQVEVELHEPIPLEYADTLVLCTDGVHGVLTEWEFGKIDWGDPQDGVWEALRLVAAREGDDNATVIACIVGEFDGVGRPVTVPPAIDPMDDGSTPSNVTFAQAPPKPAQNDSPLIDVTAPRNPTPVKPATPPPAPAAVVAPTVPATPTAKPAPELKKKPVPKKRGLWIAAAVAVFGGLAGIVSLAILLRSTKLLGSDPAAVDPPVAELATVSGGAPVEGGPEATSTAVPVAEPPPAVGLFKPVIPPEPRRAPNRPRRYLQPPPGGADQLTAITAARGRECALALGTVQSAMLNSVDHASLYAPAWSCFNETYQAKLMTASAATLDDLVRLLPYFEGPAPDGGSIPQWHRLPVDGIEYRLAAYLDSGDRDLLSDVMIDRLGVETVTDQLARDVLLEAQAAAAFATLPQPDEQVQQWWARRVYYAAASMEGSIGRQITEHRPDLLPIINASLRAATLEVDPRTLAYPEAPAGSAVLPEPVRHAWAVSRGLEPLPTERPSASASTSTSMSQAPTQTKTKTAPVPSNDGQPSVVRPHAPPPAATVPEAVRVYQGPPGQPQGPP